MKLNILILLLSISTIMLAQSVPNSQATSYRDSANNLYWNKSLPIYINISSTPDGSQNQQQLESKISEKYANPFYLDTEGLNYIRTKWAVDKETGKYASPKQEIMWEIYADGLAPVTTQKFLNANFQNINGHAVYGKNLKIRLTSRDATSKVKNIYYSINNSEFKTYTSPLSFDTDGEQNLKFLAVDNVGNTEKVKNVKFRIDVSPPKTSCVITGINIGEQNIISNTTKIYLQTKDEISGIKKIYYRIDSSAERLYPPQTNIPIKQLTDDYHTLYFYAIDKVGNKEEVQQFNFYLDKIAPITVSDLLGDKFIVDDKIYFSGRTKFKITSIDNKAGVKDILYSIDNAEFEKYSDPFYMPQEAGWHTVRYFAVDSTDNNTTGKYSKKYLEYTHKVDKIYVDLTGPALSHSIIGEKFKRRDTIFVSPNTQIRLSASDGESGLQYISYSIDKELSETNYTKPIVLKHLKSGTHTIEYFGYDNVNNRNLKVFDIVIDNSGPSIDTKFGIASSHKSNNLSVYPKGVALFIAAQDKQTGISNIYYTINNGKRNLYGNYIRGFKNGKNTIKIEAFDKLKNKTVKTIEFIIE